MECTGRFKTPPPTPTLTPNSLRRGEGKEGLGVPARRLAVWCRWGR
ncbi:hypothetical protein [Kamptonema formosum]|nr:hypothetical protein [Oscillatoria sp. PCC 10802]